MKLVVALGYPIMHDQDKIFHQYQKFCGKSEYPFPSTGRLAIKRMHPIEPVYIHMTLVTSELVLLSRSIRTTMGITNLQLHHSQPYHNDGVSDQIWRGG